MKINEINGMLDISIQHADKVTQGDPEKIQKFLSNHYTVTQKFDGVKLTLWRNAEPFDPDYRKNWIVAYKNRVLHPEEFEGPDRSAIKNDSISISQYALVHDHLKANHQNTQFIPEETEFFVEFIMNKPTTTRDYSDFHSLILIAYAPATASIGGGMFYTQPEGFHQEEIQEYAAALGMMVPPVVFEGTLDSEVNIRKGIQSEELLQAFEDKKQFLKFNDPDHASETYANIKAMFLSLESPFGGPEEGVVLLSDKGKFFKIIQADQHDKNVRFKKKQRWRGSIEEEKLYWSSINRIADSVINKTNQGALEPTLGMMSKLTYSFTEDMLPQNAKKSHHQIKDDLFLTAKERIISELPENKTALVIGKLRIFTNAHKILIEEAKQKCDHVTVALVTGKNQPFSFNLRKRMVHAVFPDVDVIEVSSGNLLSTMKKSKKIIKYVIAGSDRVEGYRDQLKKHNVEVIEVVRDFSSADAISASTVVRALMYHETKLFRNLTPKEIWPFMKELLNVLY